MNFSEWGDVDEDARNIDKEAAWDEIEDGEMPPWFYLPLHPSARLDDKEKALLKEWMLKKKPSAAAEAKEGTPPAAPPTEAAK